MNYWLDLFTGTTWKEFQDAGAKITGFRETNWKRAKNIEPGDVFLCYMVGVKRWVGLLEVTGDRYRDDVRIWAEELFPVRFPVKPLVILPPEHGVPMTEMEDKISFFPSGTSSQSWSGHVRSSPTRYKDRDGKAIVVAISEAKQNPVFREIDPKQLKRSSNIYKVKQTSDDKQIETVVSVPTEEDEADELQVTSSDAPSHTEIQWRLLHLGSQMGLSVWAPKSDRSREWAGKTVSGVPRLLDELPTQFDEVTNRTIENIDVLWLKGNAILAAFEVEHTTSVYSGLLRMCDLITMQPNIDIKLYLAAPDERFPKFKREVPRATFASRSKPLHSVCGFLPYSQLCKKLEDAKDVVKYLKPEFIDDVAIFYDPAEEFDA